MFQGFLNQRKPRENHEKSQPQLLFPHFGVTDARNARPSVSKLASEIGKFMPELYPGEHLSRASALTRQQGQESVLERLSLMVYNISNKNWDRNDRYEVNERWATTVAVLHQAGLLHHGFDVAASGDWTIKAFMDNLFCLWLEYVEGCNPPEDYYDVAGEYDVTAVHEWLLLCGVDPKPPGLGARSLRACVKLRFIDCTRVLLKAGALSQVDDDVETPLQLALKRGRVSGMKKPFHDGQGRAHWMALVHVLIQHSPRLHCNLALRAAVQTGSVEIIQHLLLNGANLVQDPPESAALCQAASVIPPDYGPEMAPDVKIDIVRFVLDALAAQNPSMPMSSFITADVFISAAGAGNMAVLGFLSTISADMGASNRHGFNALHAAASSGAVATCGLLLGQNVPIHTPSSPLSALHLAALTGRHEVIDLLIENGADVQATGTLDFNLDETPDQARYFCSKARERIHGTHRLSPLEALVRSGFPHHPPYAPFGSLRDRRWSKCLASLVRAGSRLAKGTLIASIRCGEAYLVSAVLAAGADANETCDNMSALQWAASSTLFLAEDVVTCLLNAGASLEGDEAILALQAGNWAVLRLLQGHGLSLRGSTSSGVTAFGAAMCSTSLRAVIALLGHEPKLYDARLLCHALSLRAPLPLIQQLLENRPRGAVSDHFEATAVSLAVSIDDPHYLRLLLSSLPTVSEGPVSHGQLERSHISASWQMPDTHLHEYISPLGVAVSLGNQGAFDQLRSHGCRVDWHALIAAVQKDDVPLARTIVELQPAPDRLLGQRLRGPLLEAVHTGNLDMIRLLLSAGIRPKGHSFRCYVPHRTGSMYTSPLQAAVETGNLDMMNLLLEAGADVNEHPLFSGATALQLAAIKGYLGIARHLMDLGADVNARRAANHGRTALEGAAEHGRLDMVKLLLCNGVTTVGTGRRQYVRSIRFAEENQNSVVASLLRDDREWTDEDEDMWCQDDLLSEERGWPDEESGLDMSDEDESG